MKAGVTAASRALNRPLKSVKYLEVVSSSTLDLAPTLPERAHVEYEVSEFGTIHEPFAGSIDDPSHLLVVPLRNLVGNEQWLVVAEELWDTVARHGPERQHHQFLDRILDVLIIEHDRSNRLVRTSIRVDKFGRSFFP